MTRVTAFLLLSLSASSHPAPAGGDALLPNRVSPEESGAGFRALFNGVDLTAWVHNGTPGSFTVKDGMINGDRAKKEWAYWLSTEREYGDFELRLQYRITKGGNSGIFIRAPRDGRTSRVGMEIQILDDGQKKGRPGVGSTGAIYQVAASRALASKPAGEWNDLWILCHGEQVKVTLNGVVINEISMAEYEQLKSRPRKGYIGLSAHTGPVQFRNIRLREMGGSTAAPVQSRPAQ